MLQRMITACGTTLVWGEAGGALDRIAEAFSSYEQMLGPGGQHYKFGFGGNGARQYEEFISADNEGYNKWIASMNPPKGTFINSFRLFLETAYAHPARELGYENWGIKEVQSGLESARFLKMLYPRAKFVFLVRHPFACLTSIKRREWLDRPNDARALEFYAEHWTRLAREFRQAEFGQLVKYEELITSAAVQERLGKYLDCEALNRNFKKLSRADWASHNEKSLNFMEKRRLMRIARDEMQKYDYE